MSLVAGLIAWGERTPVPDVLTRAMIAWLVGRTDRNLATQGAADDKAFAAGMDAFPVAIHTDAANAQHYEVPAAFFLRTLGPKRKYSCCFYDGPAASLAEAEVKALDLTMDHAGLADGQRILELGCGWGSLSLTMAARYPGATITAVSNSHSQRAFIEGEAARLGLTNLTIVTSDMNDFAPEGQFDRIVSVEMFEHMANWRVLLTRVRSWLKADGRLFIHVFTHRTGSYRFDAADKTDWIAQHFFTGGLMPGHGLIRQFPDLFTVEDEWRWSGEHYRRTAEDWLALFDARLAEIDPILTQVYGAENLALWRRRWRLFFLATSGLFGHAGGDSWGVSHYRLKPAP
ncbi:SAM-dependent methyltransferase [Phreatobacter oligotrophus]|uniref:SAM-dependent methyltransferase n=1 Tax=Phreatobacter oligotrophus TaxID=1122261 RepID=UPI00235406C4|nr:cyclopropane-fatty-acyl-phospholipid synthase family protein [Phreatobacter oligotrophus]MBX9990187.1 cyclopropane-fatty-acyl-phospholipid synthase family protein [Phreatobacter oligotrophus]